MFNAIFGRQEKQEPQTVRLELLNDYQQVFFTRSDYSNDILLKTCFATLAKHIAKLEPTITKLENGKRTPNKEFTVLQNCLTLTPNIYVTAYDFYYRLAYNLIQNQNAFIKINRDKFNNVISLWNLDYLSVEPRELDNEIYLKFTFKSGKKETIPYSDIIHIRHSFGDGDFISHTDSNITDNLATLDILQTSFKNKAVNSGKIKGIARIAGNSAADAWKQKARELNQNLQDSSQGGIVTTDGTVEFQAIDAQPEAADTAQLDYIRDNIYNYFGISKNIVNGKYSESEWQSFYENTIEPISISLSQEFTRKIFTQQQLNEGYAIHFSGNRLMYSEMKTKINLIRELRPLGLLTTNQCLELLNLPPIENGDDRVQTLNVANTAIVNDYQLGKLKSLNDVGRPAKDEDSTDSEEEKNIVF
jgi:HK97 family phage portal protein